MLRIERNLAEYNQIKTARIDWLNKTATYHYDQAGRLDYVENFNGTITDYGYDNANRMTSLENKTSSGAVIASYTQFVLDGNGNRTEINKVEPLSSVPGAESSDYAYNEKKNRLLSDQQSAFSYDDEGQMNSGYAATYTFDYEHRLIAISGQQSDLSYEYDGAGNRLKVIRDGVTTKYIYDARGNLLAEADGNNVITKYYIYGAGLMAMVTPTDEVYTYHYNAIGSTIAMTDQTQAIVNKYAYDPFGNILAQEEAIAQPFKFVGQHGVMTEPNGFNYMRARYYDPNVGRFISEDPIGFEGGDVNLMVYVGNNPVLLIDPEGYSGRSVLLGATSAALNTAALATIWNPVASGYFKTAGIITSTATVVNAIYEYKTRQISGAELAVTSSIEAANVLGGFAAKPVEAFVTGMMRGVGIANTAVDAAKTFGSSKP